MLKLIDIEKTFAPGTPNEKKALDHINLTVDAGEFITIIGANGAGKSTLFAAIAGDFIADSGTITLGGEDITLQPSHIRAKKIGRLFQDPMRGSAPSMSIEDNLALAARGSGWLALPSRKERQHFREKLSMLGMGLEDRMEHPVGLLSGGQRQALTLMMATINPPDILLLDEHTAALDPATADKVIEVTKMIVQKQHLTCMMITHNMHQALEIGTRTLMMDRSRIIFDVSGGERSGITVEDLLEKFRIMQGYDLDNDRMLLK